MPHPTSDKLIIKPQHIFDAGKRSERHAAFCDIECLDNDHWTSITIYSSGHALGASDDERYKHSRAFAARIVRALAMLEASEAQSASHNG